jgi:hypothetical protein
MMARGREFVVKHRCGHTTVIAVVPSWWAPERWEFLVGQARRARRRCCGVCCLAYRLSPPVLAEVQAAARPAYACGQAAGAAPAVAVVRW